MRVARALRWYYSVNQQVSLSHKESIPFTLLHLTFLNTQNKYYFLLPQYYNYQVWISTIREGVNGMENGGQLMSTCCVLQNYVHSFYGRTAISSLLSIYLCTYTVDGCHVATSVNYHDHPLALHMLSTATIVPLHCLRIGRSVGGQSAS